MRATPPSTKSTESRGSVLEMLGGLLGDHVSKEIVLEVVAKLVARNKELEKLIAQMRASKHHNERVPKEQLALLLELVKAASNAELDEANESLDTKAKESGGRPEVPKPPKQPAVRRPPAPGLRRIDNPLPVPPNERPCPTCGAGRKCVTHETTEVIDFIPAEVVVRVDRREVLVCDACDAEMARAPMGDKVVEGGAYGSALVAKLVVGKYWDGLPLYRQGQELERLGLEMPSSSMSDQITWATDLMRPIWEWLIDETLTSVVMHIDGTSLPVLDRDSPKGIVSGALWGYVGVDATMTATSAAYVYTSTAKKDGQRPGEMGPADLLIKRKGPIVADASNLFDAIFASGERTEIGCNMHARRYFVKALEAGDARAAVPVAAFRALYDVEDAVRGVDTTKRLDERQRRSRPVYDELVRWCETYQSVEPPTSLLGRAIQYLINHHLALMRFIEDGTFPIDNGIVERLHRRPAVGRRNYLFAGSHAAGERSAIAYSVLATCHLLGINPMQYLADVLPQLARGCFTRAELHEFVPARWKTTRVVAGSPAPGAS